MTAARLALNWVEQGYVPDGVIRKGIRRLCKARLAEIDSADCAAASNAREAFIAAMQSAPIALLPELANTQHYEVPAAFFAQVLGPHGKYSCCHWPEGIDELAGAEAAALALTCDRAELEDGQDILELGCGWGSLTLWMAQCYPGASITAVSNSSSQREYILARAAEQGLQNLHVITADMNDFDSEQRFDRVVSIEMFEHMRNWPALFQRIHTWLRPGGKFFMHIFCHRDQPYLFEDRGADDWMSRHFFSGGMMPSDALPARFQSHLQLLRQWRWSGRHYAETLLRWRGNFLSQIEAVRSLGYPETFIRMWLFYLGYCEAGFRERDIGTVQMLLSKPGWRGEPPLGQLKG